MKEWVKSLCPEIADWQAEFIAEAAHNMVLDEREACAKVAENRWLNKANCTAEEMYEMQKKNIADAIRARKEQ